MKNISAGDSGVMLRGLASASSATPIPTLRFDTIDRADLIDLVWHRELPLLLVSGASGAGKSVAAAQWARSRSSDSPTKWISLADHADPRDTVWGLVANALFAHPVAGVHENVASFDHLLQESSKLSEPLTLIIDDWECVSSPEHDERLVRLLERSPLLSLVVLSRYFATLAGPSTAGRLNISVIHQSDLAMSRAEIGDFAAQFGLAHEALLSQLHQDSLGWPIAVRSVLASLAPATGNVQTESGALALTTFIHEYLTAQIDILDEPAARLLMQLSLCSWLPESVLDHVIGGDRTAIDASLQRLQRAGLVCFEHRDGIQRIGCHPALAPQLRTRAQHMFGVDQAHDIQRRAAFALTHTDLLEGLQQLSEQRDLASMQEVLAADFSALLSKGPSAQRVLAPFTDAELVPFPLLLGARLILGYADPTTTQASITAWHTLLREAIRIALKQETGVPRLLLLVLLSAAERMAGNGEEALALAQQAEALTQPGQRSEQPSVGGNMALVHSTIAASGLMQGDQDLARRNYLASLQVAVSSGRPAEQLRALYGLSVTAIVEGNMRLAQSRLDEADLLAARSGATGPELSWLNGEVTRASIALESFDASALEAILEKVDPWLTRMEMWTSLVMLEAALLRLRQGEQGAFLRIKARVAETKQGFRSTEYMRAKLAAYSASLHMAIGDLDRTETQLSLLSPTHPDVATAVARLALARGEYASCIKLTQDAALLNPVPRIQCQLYFMAAMAAWKLNSRELAYSQLSEAVSWSKHWALTSPMASVPFDWLTELAESASEAGVVDVSVLLQKWPKPAQVVLLAPLSKAEVRTLQAVSKGARVEEAAAALFISPNTVKFHLRSVYRKLRAKDRGDALARATQLGLLDDY